MSRAKKISSAVTGYLHNLSWLHCTKGPGGHPLDHEFPLGLLGPNKDNMESHHEGFPFGLNGSLWSKILFSMCVKRQGYSQEDGWETGGNRPKPNSIMYQGLFQQNLPEKDLITPLLSPCYSSGFKCIGQNAVARGIPPTASQSWHCIHYFRSRAYTANAMAEMMPTAGRMYSRDRPLLSPFGALA